MDANLANHNGVENQLDGHLRKMGKKTTVLYLDSFNLFVIIVD
jgi:hypothetical protein